MPVSLTEVATALIGKPLERMVEQYNAHKPYRTVLYLTLVGEHAHIVGMFDFFCKTYNIVVAILFHPSVLVASVLL